MSKSKIESQAESLAATGCSSDLVEIVLNGFAVVVLRGF